jgi:hypothetical protein
MNNRFIISSWLLLVAILMLLLSGCRRKCAGEELPEPSTWGANTVGFRHNGQTYRFGKPQVEEVSNSRIIIFEDATQARCRFNFRISLQNPSKDTLPVGIDQWFPFTRIANGLRIPLNHAN